MNSLIGTKEFYKKTMTIAIPIILQNAITSFVAMLDNIMVGRLGTDPMSGVAIVNQLIFVFNVIVFGGLSGAGIFCAQFFGKNDYKGVSHTFKFKMYTGLFIFLASLFIFLKFGDTLISFYLHEGSQAGDIFKTKMFGTSYLKIMLWGLLPFTVSQIYSSTLRECGKINLPMIAGVSAVIINTCLNYVLIFGKFGFPKLGADGAATATVISRFTECFIVIFFTHINKNTYPFATGFFKGFKIPLPLTNTMLKKGIPLLFNEIGWASGVAIMNQCYSYRGLSAVAATNIASTINNIFSIIYLAMGSVVSIIIGQLLGAGKKEEAKDTNKKLIAFCVFLTTVIGVLMAVLSPLFPKIYNTEQEVKDIATSFILISSLLLPFFAFCHSGYFTLRSGGKTSSVFFVDNGFMYLFVIPLAIYLSRYTSINVLYLYLIIQGTEVIKCALVGYMLKRGSWAQNIVDEF